MWGAITTFLSETHRFLAGLGAPRDESDELRQKRTLAIGCTLIALFVEFGMGCLFIAFGEPQAGWYVLGCFACLLASLIAFGVARRGYYLFSFYLIFQVMPTVFVASTLLGRFNNSGYGMVWVLLCPPWAFTLHRRRYFPLWFAATVLLITLSALLQPYLRPTNNFPESFLTGLFVIHTLGLAILEFVPIFYFTNQRDSAFRLLHEAQAKTEGLLLNILPREIAAILKAENRVIADHFESASVLFADAVNFTPMSAQMTPTELVELLNEVFTAFDALVEKNGLEKIKTIGDCYMVASGVPRPREDHAQALAQLALDMQELVGEREFCGHKRLFFRVGINSGPVVAGVIGRRKFIYDLWGDAVNTASRMESHGKGGKIQITRATYELIKDEFLCEPQGAMPIKGKGQMEIWHVTARTVRQISESGSARLD
jgi:guanylate cyclase